MEAENHYSALFAQAMSTPAMMAHHHFATPPPPTIDPSSTTIKMEDFATHLAYTSSPFPPTSHPATPDMSSTSSQPDGKTGKKRKSWGQVLPEPKTNLPPRKRAKTEDEKEQRRIERVKRNRLAAHNSRERKRQEVEHLQEEKDKLEADLQAARAAMARMAAQLKGFQQRHPGEVVEETFDLTSTANETNFDALLGPSETVNPRQTSFPSPVSMASMDSPRDDSCPPETPAYTESVITDLDQTRYPAAILCDLQCRSTSQARSLPFQATLAYLTLFNLTCRPLTTSLLTICLASTRSQKLNWSSQQLAWWTAQTSSLALSSTPTPATLMAFLTRLIQSTTSTCRQPLAQRLPLATRLSQPQRCSINEVARSLTVADGAEQGSVETKKQDSLGIRQGRRQQELFALKPHLKRWLDSLEVHTGNLQGSLEES